MFSKDKLAIIKDNLEDLCRQIRNAELSARIAQDDANGHIGAMASRYDTFKEEAQYMSAAQRLRAHELGELEQKTRLLYKELQKDPSSSATVKVGSLVTIVDDHDEERSFLILFYGTGRKIMDASGLTTTIGVNSPIAQALIGREAGDEVEIRLPQKALRAEIISIV